ncbi:unnamed protein product, partial [Rotaria socialis]
LCNNENPIFKSAQSTTNKSSLLSNLTTVASTSTTPVPSTKDYHCDTCQQTFKFTSIEILRHRATH